MFIPSPPVVAKLKEKNGQNYSKWPYIEGKPKIRQAILAEWMNISGFLKWGASSWLHDAFSQYNWSVAKEKEEMHMKLIVF